MSDYDVKWYKYEMVNYQSFFKSNIPIKDKPFIIFNTEKYEKFTYLKNTYQLACELDNHDNFIQENAFRILNDKNYPSKVVDFLGNDNFVETYFLKNSMLESNLYKIKTEKKEKC